MSKACRGRIVWVEITDPWDRKRHLRTGLKERCAAVCTWLKKVTLADVKEYAGTVPGKQMLEILRKVGSLPP